MQSSSLSTVYDLFSDHDPYWGQDPWLTFNQQLNRDATGLPNEAFLDQALKMALDLEIVDPRVFWLTISRIAELAIKLAGDYADSCEFQAAGDLLVNPRRIDVYQRGNTAKIQKDRHSGLSDQFAAVIGSENPVTWLKRETHLQIKSEALLPHLKGSLQSSRYMTADYLHGFEKRMCRVSDTIAFLSAWNVTDNRELFKRIQHASSTEQALIIGNLCYFDDRYFVEMGENIKSIILRGEGQSRFLKRTPTICQS
ncbi:hypothetical protein Dvar_79210 [Desulfosarcina variabilis str. Montpellier]|uniref:hypothetical protein n=1 Tax=Desulfosarcina variabilis TaxID=2300 RepID=UPI003AFAD01C